MTKPLTAAMLWKRFQTTTIPRSASPTQHKEMKKAFYSGMAVMLGTLESLDDSLSDDEGVEVLEGYKQELMQALESFSKGFN